MLIARMVAKNRLMEKLMPLSLLPKQVLKWPQVPTPPLPLLLLLLMAMVVFVVLVVYAVLAVFVVVVVKARVPQAKLRQKLADRYAIPLTR